jgi:hypothetical protein
MFLQKILLPHHYRFGNLKNTRELTNSIETYVHHITNSLKIASATTHCQGSTNLNSRTLEFLNDQGPPSIEQNYTGLCQPPIQQMQQNTDPMGQYIQHQASQNSHTVVNQQYGYMPSQVE